MDKSLERNNQEDLHTRNLLEALPVAIFKITKDGHIVRLNSEALKLVGGEEIDILSTSVDSLLTPSSKLIFTDFLRKINSDLRKHTCDLDIILSSGQVQTIRFQGKFQPQSELVYLTATELLQTVLSDVSYQSKFEDISNVAQIGRWELDHKSKNLIWSKKIFEIFELDPNLFLPSYETFISVIHPDDRGLVEEAFSSYLQNKEKYELDHRVIMSDGRTKWVRETCISTFTQDGKPVKTIGTSQDISKQKEIELFLQKSEANYYRLVENTSSLIWSCDQNGNFTYLNPAWETVLGYSRDEMIDRSFADFQPISNSIRDKQAMQTFHLKNEATKNGFETLYITKSGEESYLIFYPTAIYGDQGEVIGSHGTAIDITQKRKLDLKLEETYFELGQRQFAIDQHAIVAITNLQGDIVYVNRLFCEISKYPREELVGQNHRIINSGFHPPEFFMDLYRTIKQGNTWHGEIKNRAKDGSYYWVATTIAPIKNARGEIEKYLSIRTDITEIKEADEQIQNLLEEKSLILIEVHHRIKNNMNTIFSLLRIEANAQENPAQKAVLLDASNRVRSMMLLYDKLYRSENIDVVSIKEYFPVLILEILDIFPNKEEIITDIHVESIAISAKKLSSIGIIINELVTNSMKYSFSGKTSGIIRFRATVEGQILKLVYEDDGVPIDSNIKFSSANSFGLNLISMLIQQLKGTINMELVQGTKYIMEFNI